MHSTVVDVVMPDLMLILTKQRSVLILAHISFGAGQSIH